MPSFVKILAATGAVWSHVQHIDSTGYLG